MPDIAVRMKRCRRDPKPLGPDWNSRVIDRLHIDIVMLHKDIGYPFALGRIAHHDRNDMARIIHMRDTVAIECCPHLDNRFLVERPLARALLQMLNRGNSSGG